MWFKIQGDTVRVQIIAKPLAKKTALINISEQGLQIAIHGKPHKGQANKELIFYLSKIFQVPKSKIILEAGENSRYKRVIIPLTTTVHKIIKDSSFLLKQTMVMK